MHTLIHKIRSSTPFRSIPNSMKPYILYHFNRGFLHQRIVLLAMFTLSISLLCDWTSDGNHYHLHNNPTHPKTSLYAYDLDVMTLNLKREHLKYSLREDPRIPKGVSKTSHVVTSEGLSHCYELKWHTFSFEKESSSNHIYLPQDLS